VLSWVRASARARLPPVSPRRPPGQPAERAGLPLPCGWAEAGAPSSLDEVRDVGGQLLQAGRGAGSARAGQSVKRGR
jgi:hypothetical protein